MIGNTNSSKTPGSFVNVPLYTGVASVHIVAINPSNEVLRNYGWNIQDGAEEPVYVGSTTKEDGTIRRYARVRFLAQIQDFEDKPVIPLDFVINPEPWYNTTRTKGQVIDSYGRTVWATNEEINNGIIPTYVNGPAKISIPYKRAHRGEEELVAFMRKYLVCAPFERYDSARGVYVKNANPGVLTIDNWEALCNGNAAELKGYIAREPNNCVKVILGVKHTDNNRDRQVFVTDFFISNGMSPNNGIYDSAQRAIDKLKSDGYHDSYEYSAAPVSLYTVTPTVVKQEAEAEVPEVEHEDLDDLPFGD